MKKIAILFIVLIAFLFLSCPPEDEKKDDTIIAAKQIDPALVGGFLRELKRTPTSSTSGIYYHGYKTYSVNDVHFGFAVSFTKNAFIKGTLKYNNPLYVNDVIFTSNDTISAYSQNNKVYSLENDNLLFSYEFIVPDYFGADLQAAISANNNAGKQGNELNMQWARNKKVIGITYPDQTFSIYHKFD